MKETTKKGAEFYAKWEKIRLSKWRYVFLHGVLYYGVPVGVLFYAFHCRFRFENMDVFEFITALVAFGLGGVFMGLREYNQVDSMYLGLNDDDEIKKGVRTLLSGERWEYENLMLSLDKDGGLVVRTGLFWLDKATPTAEELDGCLNQLMDDVARLRKHAGFNEVARTRNVTVQVFYNSAGERPLVEKTLAKEA